MPPAYLRLVHDLPPVQPERELSALEAWQIAMLMTVMLASIWPLAVMESLWRSSR